jgi:tetratricopeptide (TPR) repeat protein
MNFFREPDNVSPATRKRQKSPSGTPELSVADAVREAADAASAEDEDRVSRLLSVVEKADTLSPEDESTLAALGTDDSLSPPLRAQVFSTCAPFRARRRDNASALRMWEDAVELDDTPQRRRSLRVQSALVAVDADDLVRARELTDSVLRDEPSHLDALAALGRIHVLNGEFADAIDVGRQLVLRRPSAGRALIALALTAEHRLSEDPGVLEAVIAEPPPDPWTLTRLGEALIDDERDADARRVLDLAVELEPDAPDTLRARGLAGFVLGDYVVAAADLDRAAQVYDDSLLRATRGEVARILGDRDAAIELLRSVPVDEGPPWLLGSLGLALLENENSPEARGVLERALQRDPDDVFARLVLAQVVLTEEDYPRAESLARRAIELDLGDAQGYAVLGETLRHQGRNAEAVEAFDQALDLNSDFPYALGSKGQVLAAQGEFAQAVPILAEAAVAAPGVDWILDELESAAEKQDKDGADVVLRGVQRKLADKDHIQLVCIRRARLAYRQKRFSASDRLYTKARQAAPTDADLLSEHFNLLMELSRYDEALSLLDNAPAELAGTDDLMLLRVYVLWQMERLAETRTELNRLVRQDNPHPDALAAFAEINRRDGERGEARELVERALAVDRENAAALGTLGALELQEGDIEAARDILQTVVAKDPADGPALNQLVMLESAWGTAQTVLDLAEHLRNAEPRDLYLDLIRVHAEYRLGSYSAALDLVEDCLAEPHAPASFWYWQGWLQLALGRAERAAQSFRSAATNARSDSDRFFAQQGMLTAYDWDNALNDAVQSCQDGEPGASSAIALLWLECGEYEAAANHAMHARDMLLKDEDRVYLLTRSLRLAGRVAEALEFAEEAHNRWPTNVYHIAYLAEAMVADGRPDDAADLHRKVVDRLEKQVYVGPLDWHQLGWSLLRAGELEKSGQMFLRALSATSQTAEMLCNLMLISLLGEDTQIDALVNRASEELERLPRPHRRAIVGGFLNDLTTLNPRFPTRTRAQIAQLTDDFRRRWTDLSDVPRATAEVLPLDPK